MLKEYLATIGIIGVLIIYYFASSKWDKAKKFEGTYAELSEETKETINDKLLLVCACEAAFFACITPITVNRDAGIIFFIFNAILFYRLDNTAKRNHYIYKTISGGQYFVIKFLLALMVILAALI